MLPSLGKREERYFRLCINFQKYRVVAMWYRTDDILDDVGNSRYFSTLTLAKRYHQILINQVSLLNQVCSDI